MLNKPPSQYPIITQADPRRCDAPNCSACLAFDGRVRPVPAPCAFAVCPLLPRRMCLPCSPRAPSFTTAVPVPFLCPLQHSSVPLRSHHRRSHCRRAAPPETAAPAAGAHTRNPLAGPLYGQLSGVVPRAASASLDLSPVGPRAARQQPPPAVDLCTERTPSVVL